MVQATYKPITKEDYKKYHLNMINESSFFKHENQESPLDPILSKIMTMGEYSQMHHETPYIFDLKAGNKELHYFGAPHVRDPKDPIFSEIKAAFDLANPDIVFVEGINVRGNKNILNEKIKNETSKELIDSAGEAGFTLKLASDKGIEWQSPEPNDEELYKHLLKQGFSKDEIFVRGVLLVLPQYNRQMNKETFKEYALPFIEQFKEATNWEGFDYSYKHAIKLSEDILGGPVNLENEEEASDYIDPTPWEEKKEKQTVLNRVGEASSIFRDKYIVSSIAEALKTHKRLFVVYGASHAVMQEPALKELFEKE